MYNFSTHHTANYSDLESHYGIVQCNSDIFRNGYRIITPTVSTHTGASDYRVNKFVYIRLIKSNKYAEYVNNVIPWDSSSHGTSLTPSESNINCTRMRTCLTRVMDI